MMDNELIDRLAREAGACAIDELCLVDEALVDSLEEFLCLSPEQLAVLAALVAEACIDIADRVPDGSDRAAAIRAKFPRPT